MSDFSFTCTALGRRPWSIDICDNYLLLSHLANSYVHMKIYPVDNPLHPKMFHKFPV